MSNGAKRVYERRNYVKFLYYLSAHPVETRARIRC